MLAGKGKKKTPQWWFLEPPLEAVERAGMEDAAFPPAEGDGDAAVHMRGEGDTEERRRLAIIDWMVLTREEQEQRIATHKIEKRQRKEEEKRREQEERANAPCEGVWEPKNRLILSSFLHVNYYLLTSMFLTINSLVSNAPQTAFYSAE